MIKNIIFDFGGVIAKFDPLLLTKPYVTDYSQQKIIADVVFDRKYWNELDMGCISDVEVKKDFVKRLNSEQVIIAEKVYDNWIYNLIPIEGMDEVIDSVLKMKKKLYLLSDISIGFANTYKNVNWINKQLSVFDGLTFSGIEHMVKPHRKTFENILRKYTLNAEECLFIDDNPENIKGANSAGINGYVFDGDVLKLKKFLLNI